MDFQPTAGQAQALEAIERLRVQHPGGGGVLVISGYAGTGKTTLLRALTAQEPVLVLTPTGKAAQRAQEAGGADALTVHRWLYSPVFDEETWTLSFTVKARPLLQRPQNGLLVVDEASMLGRQLWTDLYRACLDLRLNVVLIGDGYQLPPVQAQGEAFSVFSPGFPANERVGLTEVLRQALDSPIIRASMAVREDRGCLEALAALPRVRQAEVMAGGHQVFRAGGATVCHRRKTRAQLNRGIRALEGLGPGDPLRPGEPLLVEKNNYRLDRYNGEILTLLEVAETRPATATDKTNNRSVNADFHRARVDGDAWVVFGQQDVLQVWPETELNPLALERAGNRLARRLNWVVPGLGPDPETGLVPTLPYLRASLGYALTVHKAQGSEWDQVLVVVEPSVRLSTTEGKRWVYTALTRAKTIVKTCFWDD